MYRKHLHKNKKFLSRGRSQTDFDIFIFYWRYIDVYLLRMAFYPSLGIYALSIFWGNGTAD